MSKIRIVTDSTADIPREVREALDIEMVPLKVHIDGETHLDNVTLQPEQFYEKLRRSREIPTTSQPSPADFLEVYKRILGEEPGVSIVSIHLSSRLSGTYQSAMLTKSLLDEQADITIVDSKSASYGIGMLVVAAAEAARAGLGREEIVELVGRLRKSTRLYFLVETLEYLHKGGRIGKASALIGALLNIKPILTIDDDGEVAPVDKVRGQKKAMARIAELFEREFGGAQVRVVLAHAMAMDTAEELAQLLRSRLAVADVKYTEIGPVIGTHAGPGAVGVFVEPM